MKNEPKQQSALMMNGFSVPKRAAFGDLSAFMKKAVRRALDVTLSSAILIFTFPLMLLIALCLRIDSPGSVLFRQTRIGYNRRKGERRKAANSAQISTAGIQERRRNGNNRRRNDLNGAPFQFYKFRTMYGDARKRFPELYAYRYREGELKTTPFKHENDPRHTNFGRFLRKTSLDELPNFINVVKGDMTLVGPRPDIPEMMRYYDDWEKVKFDVLPGVTGLAQINGRGCLPFKETLKKDVEYVRSRSLSLDLKIVLQTVISIIRRSGAF